ncbi:MAG: N-acetyltransferase family protein [Sulfitobacter sp.]
MIIGPAAQADLPQVQSLWNAMIADTNATFTARLKSDADMETMLHARAECFLVARDRDGVAGFITWGMFRAGDGYAHTAEHSIITARPRQGVGRDLMRAACDKAAAQGIHMLIAGIGGENSAAVAFHARMGFELAGRLPQVGRKNGAWHDLILMNRALTKP